MGLLKQNGENGKIIRAQGTGKVLKQNYNFGNKFIYSPSNRLDAIKDIKSLTAGGITFIFWYYFVGNSTNSIRFKNQNEEYQYVRCAGNGLNVMSWIDCYLQQWGNKKLCCIDPISGGYYRKDRNYILPSTHLSDFGTFINEATSLELSLYVNGQAALWIFDRPITYNEFVYSYNNNLGNDLLNKSGLIGEYRFNEAAIVNDNSIDKVVVKDYSPSQNHLEFKTLPAGTIQEQLDYANANLFSIW